MKYRSTCVASALLLAVLLSLAGALAAKAQEDYEVPPPPVAFTGGLDTRIRQVFLHNLLDFDDDGGPAADKLLLASDAHFFRIRHRIWGQFKLHSGPRLFARFTTEWRKYLDPYLAPEKTQIIADNLYLDIPRLPGVPLSARIGRQDIVRGEGFILLEGGPADGSRSIYHNALLLGFDAQELGLERTKVELLAIRNPAWDPIPIANGATDEQKASPHGQYKPIVENDETALGAYITSRLFKPQQIEAYYLYKEEEDEALADPHLKLHTLGARLSGELPADFDYAAEGAVQFGTHELEPRLGAQLDGGAASLDHRSYGGYAWIARDLLFLWRPRIKTGAVFLSGDDPAERDLPCACDDIRFQNEAWVPPFSRWPKWSELYIYTLIPEQGRVANWSNMLALHASIDFTLSSKSHFSYGFYYLRAPYPLVAEDGAGAHTTYPLYGTGNERGQLHRWKFSTQLTDAVTWHFLVERFAAGDFYYAQDDAYFLRWELMWKR